MKVVIIEAVIITIYTYFLNFIIIKLNYSKIIKLFILGFIKHFLFGIAKIHQNYCKSKYNLNTKSKTLLLESIIEGILFIILGNFIDEPALIAFILHILFELLGFHKLYCLNSS